jgi:hypothetical protein
VAKGPRAMIGGTLTPDWMACSDEAYDEANQKGRKQKMYSCDDDTILKYSTMRSRPACEHIVTVTYYST